MGNCPSRVSGRWCRRSSDTACCPCAWNQGMDFDLKLLGFSKDELAKIFDPGVKEGLTDPDEIPEPPDEAIIAQNGSNPGPAQRRSVDTGRLHPCRDTRPDGSHRLVAAAARRKGYGNRGCGASGYRDGRTRLRASNGAPCGALGCPNWCPRGCAKKAADFTRLHRSRWKTQRKRRSKDRRKVKRK